MIIRGCRVVLAGLVSAKATDTQAMLDSVERMVVDAGAIVVGRVLQRRGVSHAQRPGGARQMDQPLSSTVLGSGKTRELADLCAAEGAELVVFLNELNTRQREQLATACRVPIHDRFSIGLTQRT